MIWYSFATHTMLKQCMYLVRSVLTNSMNIEISTYWFHSTLSVEQYTDNYFELHYKLQDLFGIKIDLLTDKSLSNPYFINEMEQTNNWSMQLEIQKYLFDQVWWWSQSLKIKSIQVWKNFVYLFWHTRLSKHFSGILPGGRFSCPPSLILIQKSLVVSS